MEGGREGGIEKIWVREVGRWRERYVGKKGGRGDIWGRGRVDQMDVGYGWSWKG